MFISLLLYMLNRRYLRRHNKQPSSIMGFWFLSSAFSAYVGACMAKLSAVGEVIDQAGVTRDVYGRAFLEIAAIVFVVMLISLLCRPLMRKLIK